MATHQSTDSIYQLKITLVGSKPPIWRRVLVPASIKLSELHLVLQAIMNWEDYHLHMFSHNDTNYGAPLEDDIDFGLQTVDEKKFKLEELLTEEGHKITYTYDFGDNWEHAVLLEKILPREDDGIYPRVIKGKRQGPPEDCGGVWGYEEILEAIASPKHPEHKTYLKWIGKDFNPEEFDLETIQHRLTGTKPVKKTKKS